MQQKPGQVLCQHCYKLTKPTVELETRMPWYYMMAVRCRECKEAIHMFGVDDETYHEWAKKYRGKETWNEAQGNHHLFIPGPRVD